MSRSSLHDAVAALFYHNWGTPLDDESTPVPVAAGEDRTVYRLGDVIYKVGTRATANPYDHDTQCEARRRGYRWVPAWSELYDLANEYGDRSPILAMPYLANDGSMADPVLLAEMQAQAGAGRAPHRLSSGAACENRGCWCRNQIDSGNYVVIGGQPIVIDFCTVRLGNDESEN